MKVLIAVGLFVLTSGPGSSLQVPAAADAVTRAHALIDAMARGDFASATAGFSAQMKTALPEERLRTTWASLVTQAGAFKRQVTTRGGDNNGFRIVIVTCEFERATIDVQVVFDQALAVSGLRMSPGTPITAPYALPDYAVPSAYSEEEVLIGKLPGTLTIPTGTGPFPAVVLVQGSGPSDRDESVGAEKPFKDLAVGLASKGIAVLRYEKRTKQLGALANTPGFTVKDETIDDSLAALMLVRAQSRIDPARSFVLGHSLGGMLVPRIVTGDSRLAGAIIMAGATRPMEQAILDQTRYLALADGSISAEEQAQLEALTEQVNLVHGLKPADAANRTPILGAPASYWLDLRGYDPPIAAKALSVPLLILQGERDYQVTMTDDFARWQSTLGSKPGVTIKTYPALNHLFIAGTGKSLPAEYSVPGHVSADVVRDIATWITTR